MFQKHLSRSIFGSLLTIILVALSCNALAQTNLSPSEVREKLSALPASRFEAHWQITTKRQPNPKLNTAAYVAQLQSVADPQAKLPAAQQKEVLQQQERYAKALQSGATFMEKLNIVRVGDKIMAESVGTDSLRSNNKVIDFYDGTNAASFIEISQIIDGVEQKTYQGTVTRNPEEVLSHSAPDDVAILLTQAPITPHFNARNSEVAISDGKVTLKKGVISQTSRGPLQLGYSTQLVLSSPELYPIALRMLDNKGKVLSEFVVKEYKKRDGKKIPSLIVSQDVASGKPGGEIREFKLLDSAHGAEVDTAKLKLPTDVLVSDYRFGNDNGVSYQLKDGTLLSDQEVRKLLGEKSQEPTQTMQQKSNLTPLMLLLGFGLIGIGGVVWKKGAPGK